MRCARRKPAITASAVRPYLIRVSFHLHAVCVQHYAEGSQTQAPGGERRLPHLPFLQLPIAQDDIDAIGEAAAPPRKRHAHPDREPLPQRAAGRLDERSQALGDIDLQRRAVLAYSPRPRARKQTAGGQGGVEHRRVVRGRQDAAVALGPARVVRVQAQLRKV